MTLESNLQALQKVQAAMDADAMVINSCTVRQPAEVDGAD